MWETMAVTVGCSSVTFGYAMLRAYRVGACVICELYLQERLLLTLF